MEMMFWLACLYVWGWMTTWWLISIWLHNASIVDIIYSLNFAIITGLYLTEIPQVDLATSCFSAAIFLWATRLCTHLLYRNWGTGEDKRYQRFRENYGKERYWWFSYFQVFLLQGLLVILFAAPIHVLFYSTSTPLSYVQIAVMFFGGLLSTIGLVYESIADWQLLAFKRQAAPGTFLSTGLWAYSRHPNYFGEILFWFGLATIASAKTWDIFSFVAFAGPTLLAFVIYQLSGPKNQEPHILKSRLGYGSYQAIVPAIIPSLKAKRAYQHNN